MKKTLLALVLLMASMVAAQQSYDPNMVPGVLGPIFSMRAGNTLLMSVGMIDPDEGDTFDALLLNPPANISNWRITDPNAAGHRWASYSWIPDANQLGINYITVEARETDSDDSVLTASYFTTVVTVLPPDQPVIFDDYRYEITTTTTTTTTIRAIQ